jgi:hypothetical protein
MSNVIDSESGSHHTNTSEKTMSSSKKSKIGPVKESAEYSQFVESDLVSMMPAPLAGPRFDALKQSIAERGQLLPISVDENNAVLDGRSRLKACQELNLPVRYQIVPAARDPRETILDGAQHRDWTVREKADFVRYVFEHAEQFGINCKKGERRDLVGEWLEVRMGWLHGTSDKNISNYIKLSKQAETADEAVKKQVSEAATLNKALRLVAPLSTSDSDPAGDRRIALLNEVISEFSMQSDEPMDERFMKAVREARDLLDGLLRTSAVA